MKESSKLGSERGLFDRAFNLSPRRRFFGKIIKS